MNPFARWHVVRAGQHLLPALVCLLAAGVQASETLPVVPAADSVVVTSTGQRVYERTRQKLLQVRTLLRQQDSQSTVGSGFLVDDGSLLITNYHVVSEYAQQPSRHRLVYATVDGQQGALQLLAFDVVNDLALLRLAEPAALAGRGSIALRPASQPLSRGARMFALGNPLDVGFAVAEGTFNGTVERSFLHTLFFGGSLSGGMSGGPALDEQGQLIGVNVATRRDGEQVSFLVPSEPVRKLLERGRSATPVTTPAWGEIGRQLLAHQEDLTRQFMDMSWRDAGHPRVRIPVPQERFMRCWGNSSPPSARGLQFERSECTMDSRVFVGGALQTGYIGVSHLAYDGTRLGRLRFAERYSTQFGNHNIQGNDQVRTAAQCVEHSVNAAAQAGQPALPLKAVLCLRAYKKLPGLHDLVVLAATLDQSTAGVHGRFEAQGVSLASAQRLAQHYLNGFAWNASPPGPSSGSR